MAGWRKRWKKLARFRSGGGRGSAVKVTRAEIGALIEMIELLRRRQEVLIAVQMDVAQMAGIAGVAVGADVEQWGKEIEVKVGVFNMLLEAEELIKRDSGSS